MLVDVKDGLFAMGDVKYVRKVYVGHEWSILELDVFLYDETIPIHIRYNEVDEFLEAYKNYKRY